ncbi:MAG TPA: sulfatase [Terracidiphilus sp.]
MNRRDFLRKVGVTGAALTAAPLPMHALTPEAPPAKANAEIQVSDPAARSDRRNILLFIADDHSPIAGCYGTRAIKTPHLDRLAASGVRFTQASTPVSSCSPSRACLLTGLYQHTNGQYGLAHGMHNQHSVEGILTLPAIFRAAGYVTGLVGKKHVKPLDAYRFDWEYLGLNEGDGHSIPVLEMNRNVAEMAVMARGFFKQAQERPFVLVVAWGDPHRGEGEHGDDFSNKPYAGVPATRYDPADVDVPSFLPDLPEVREDLAEYYQAISRMDHGIGLILDELKEAGHGDNTMVIYTSDHGMPFPCVAKTNQYDPALRVPLLVSAPDMPGKGSTRESFVSHVDMLPTLMEWAGIQKPRDYKLPGRSFLPLLGADSSEGRDEVYGSHTMHEVTMFYPMRSIRTREFRYILNLLPESPVPMAVDVAGSRSWKAIVKHRPDKIGGRTARDLFHRPAEELYDLRKDPEERTNVAPDPAYESTLQGFRERMKKFREETKDIWLTAPWRDGNEFVKSAS